MLELILKSLYFFLPAYLANMAPVFAMKLKVPNKPIWEKRLGTHKTWRGVVSAALVGLLVFWLQKIAYVNGFRSLALIDYSDVTIMLGFFIGLGAIVGDAVKSYYKRKADIKPGKSWVPFDQIDFVIGGIIGSFFIYVPKAEVVLILLLISPLLHVAANIIGYWLKINDKMF
jgi:CDP-2,3-bis-(O-geranylgeranyl)-sn-glycerol synthase